MLVLDAPARAEAKRKAVQIQREKDELVRRQEPQGALPNSAPKSGRKCQNSWSPDANLEYWAMTAGEVCPRRDTMVISRAVLVTIGCLVLLGGCMSNKPPGSIKYVYASDVINELKDQLAEVQARPLNKDVEVPDGACGVKLPNKTVVHVEVSFDTADVVLKTVATDTNTGTAAAAKVPLGTVLIGASASYTRTTIRTQQVTYSLGPDPYWKRPPTESPFAEAAPNRPFNPPAPGELTVHKAGAAPNDQSKSSELGGIAEAIFAARDQILAIDHGRKPCLLPTKVKVEIDFQVQQKTDIKGDVAFLVFADIGGEHIKQRESANSLIVTFTLSGSSATLD